MNSSHGLGLLGMVRRSLRQHALSTAVTVLSTALASGLAMAVFGISQQAYEAFTGGQTGFDAVLGARGSALQLVLNTVFQLETSPGNIPWSYYKAIAAAGIEKRLPPSPYDLRGTFCMHRAMVVKSFRQIQTEMGHASPKSIEHYLAVAGHHRMAESIFNGIPDGDLTSNRALE